MSKVGMSLLVISQERKKKKQEEKKTNTMTRADDTRATE
jgi:hypothetical protein